MKNTTSISTSDQPKNLAQYRKVHGEADEVIRKVANFRDKVVIPAINELRYAGHHLLKSIDDDGSVIDNKELQKAINHCHRAMYEAIDAGIICALGRIKIFQDDYKKTVVADLIPNYREILVRSHKAQSQSAKARDHGENSVSMSDEYISLYNSLVEDCYSLDLMRDEINKRLRESIRSYRRWIFTIALMVIGVFTSIILLF